MHVGSKEQRAQPLTAQGYIVEYLDVVAVESISVPFETFGKNRFRTPGLEEVREHPAICCVQNCCDHIFFCAQA
jgi:hypothetical protein